MAGKKINSKIYLVSGAHLLHDTYTAFLAQALPMLMTKLGFSTTLAGVLAVIQRIPSMFNFLVGILAENVKARYFVIFSPALTAVAMSLIGVAPGYGFLAILLFVSGFSSTLFHVPAPVMIKKLSGDRLGRGMSFFMLGGELARTLGPLVIVGAVSLWGIEGTWKLMPFGLLASFILYLKLRRVDISQNLPVEKERGHYWKIFRKFLPVFLAIAGITLFQAGMKSSLTFYLPTFITAKTGNYEFSGISLSVLQLAGAAGTFYSGTFSDRIGRKTALFIITLVSPVLMWLFIHTSGIWTLPVLVILGFFMMAPTSVFLAIIHELKTEHLSFVNGVYMTLNFFINALMVMLVGYVSDHLGMETTFKLAAVFAVFAVFFAMRLPGVIRKKQLRS